MKFNLQINLLTTNILLKLRSYTIRSLFFIFFLAFTTQVFSKQTNPNSADKQHEPEVASDLVDNGQFISSKASVATANAYATNAAVEILKKGGNAVDASIAAMLVLGVVEPHASGIGGGGLALVYNNTAKKIRFFDGRETAPADIKEDIFMNGQKPMDFNEAAHSGISVGVPGFLALAKEMHKKQGRLPWNSLFTNAIDLAQNGFEMSDRIHSNLENFLEEIKRVNDQDAIFSDYGQYFDKKGNIKPRGSIIRNQKLAITLKRLSLADGVEYFYNGPIASHIVQKVANDTFHKSSIKESDFKNYTAVERDPICIDYKDQYKICTADSPSSGITVLEALKIAESYDLKSLYYENLSQFINVCFESLKLAFADRNIFFADDRFVKYDSSKFLNPKYVSSRSRLIKPDYAKSTYDAGYNGGLNNDYGKSDTTTHVSVIDEQGNAVSFTNSIENGWGSMSVVDGFILNNTLTDFNFNPILNDKPAANRPEGSKKPRSSMSPIIIFNSKDGSVVGVLGSPGGARIISYVFKNIALLLDVGLSPQVISKLPNFATMNSGNVEIEKRTEASMQKIAKDLEKFGQKVSFDNDLTSGVNIISVSYDCGEKSLDGSQTQIQKSSNLQQKNCRPIYTSYADFRRSGLASGY
jgi:gamma-glutamyltranspeptidase/glutathione hydrolase